MGALSANALDAHADTLHSPADPTRNNAAGRTDETDRAATRAASTDVQEPQYDAPRSGRATLERVIGAFKSLTTVHYGEGVRSQKWTPFDGRLWQRNYFERIIRDSRELANVRAYIKNSPSGWTSDPENPEVSG